jgi:hypothetical protein
MRTLSPFFGLLKQAQKKPVAKKPAAKKVVSQKDKANADIVSKKYTTRELVKKYPTLKKSEIIGKTLETVSGGADSYKKYVANVNPYIGSSSTNIDNMHAVYKNLRDSGLPEGVIASLKDDWFGDEGNLDWTRGGDGQQTANDMMEQIQQRQQEQGVSSTNTTDSPAGIYAGNMPFSQAPEGLDEEASKIKKRRESMKQPDKDIANRYINKSKGEKADVYDSHPDQAMYERGIDSLRGKMKDLGI